MGGAASQEDPESADDNGHARDGNGLSKRSLWAYRPVNGLPINIREEPRIDGPKTPEKLHPEETFEVAHQEVDRQGVIFLELADGRGWIFDRKPEVGVMCVFLGKVREEQEAHGAHMDEYGSDSESDDGRTSIAGTPTQVRPRIDSADASHLQRGGSYEGQRLGGLRHGRGVQIFPDGARYEGEWDSDAQHGQGRFVHLDGDVYAGEFERDFAHGQGSYMHADGSRYDGQWRRARQDGQGKETYRDGSQYEGEYRKGLKHGSGRLSWVDGSNYQGNFYNDALHGMGTYKWRDGRTYVGEWADSQMHGRGKHSWTDGQTYEGEYSFDRKSGHGKLSKPDGRFYEGQFLDGVQHGKITQHDPQKGKTSSSMWEKGKKVTGSSVRS